MSSRVYDLASRLADAIASSEALKTFCLQQFGRAHTTYLGIDTNNPPADSLVPWVAVIPTSEGKAETYDHDEKQLTIVTASYEDTATTSPAGVVQMPGYSSSFELASRVWTVIEPYVLEDVNQTTFALLAHGEIRVQHASKYYHSAQSITVAEAI